eukprot:7088159-Prymnesium_polylepis.1
MRSKYVRRSQHDGNGLSMAVTPSLDKCASGCSEHGKCWQGRCLCEPGFQGYDCTEAVSCPANCHVRRAAPAHQLQAVRCLPVMGRGARWSACGSH